MSRPASLRALASRAGRLVRTLRPLRPAQLRAQLRHALVGTPAPVHLDEPPPALAVTPAADAFLDPPAHVRALGPGRIELLARPFELGAEIDWEATRHGPLFAYHLHQHEYLRRPDFSPRERGRILLDWIERHRAGVGWDPHPISLRLLCWGKLLLTPGALALEPREQAAMLASLADQAETLHRGIEVRLQANHLWTNLLAVVWAGVLVEGPRSEAWRGRSAWLVRELDAQVHPDGGHEERSPMYHALLLEQLLDLLALGRRAPERMPDGLEERLRGTAERMLVALEVFTHPDGRIALFADSGLDVAAEPAALARHAARLDVRCETPAGRSWRLPETGYVRLRRGDTSLLASVAGPAPPHQPGHAHCDALSFELALGSARFVSDTGSYEYVVGERRHRARSTLSHATACIDGEEQAELWSAHRVGGRPRVAWVGWDGAGEAEAGCCGWSRPDTLHRRRFRVAPGEVEILDRIEGPCRSLRLTWPIDPAWQVVLCDEGRRALATRAVPRDAAEPAGAASRVEVSLAPALSWRLEAAPFYPSFGRELERPMLIGEGAGVSAVTTRIRVVA